MGMLNAIDSVQNRRCQGILANCVGSNQQPVHMSFIARGPYLLVRHFLLAVATGNPGCRGAGIKLNEVGPSLDLSSDPSAEAVDTVARVRQIFKVRVVGPPRLIHMTARH